MKRLLAVTLSTTLALAGCQDTNEPLAPAEAPAFSLTGASLDIDPALTAALSGAAETDQLEVIVGFDETLTSADAIAAAIQDLDAGVIGFKHLPMVAALATPTQVTAIQSLAGVQSLYLNTAQELLNAEGTASVKADQVHALGVTGKGVGVAILDTGIDGDHPDLAFGSKTVQNAKMVGHTKDLYTFAGRDETTGLKTPKPVKKGAELYVENVTNTDTDKGHGTHVSGTVAGTGGISGGKYGGVAPGAHLVGVAAAVGGSLPTIMLLAGFDYIIDNQAEYNIQVVNNSWGSSGAFRPASPIAVATKETHDAGITVVFAGGNSGPEQNTMNPHSVAPWVISVAAGCKLGEDPTGSRVHCEDPNGREPVLADFSSRGIPGDPMYHPDVLAPGVHIVSTRALTGFAVTGSALLHDARICAIATEYVEYYTCISGTSMASPMVTGIVALMEEASGGTLTPDQALAALTQTARPIAGYAKWEIGAGYADALAAVKAVRK
ncbi:hypothetical protein BH20GEM2_BH20GEM2_05110 [soil metagenome]